MVEQPRNRLLMWPLAIGLTLGLSQSLPAATTRTNGDAIALTATPNEDPEVLYQGAQVLIREGRLPEAIAQLLKARQTAAKELNIDILWLLASIYERSDQLDQAIATYTEIAQTVPPDSEKYRIADYKRRYTEATRAAKSRDIEKARNMFEELAKESPNDLLTLYSLGVAEMLGNHLDEARSTFQRVLELDSGYLNAYLNLARIDQQTGNLGGAADLLRKVIELSPADQRAAKAAQIELDLIEAGLLLNDGNEPAALEM